MTFSEAHIDFCDSFVPFYRLLLLQSYSEWIGDIGWGGVAEHPSTPLVYDASWEWDNADGNDDSEEFLEYQQENSEQQLEQQQVEHQEEDQLQ